ncbi:hypothetical protein PR048_021693 [Dryococelus australis]|uniref:Uncharacterized protein n=1 Tax=Dryococelus australis TaxID=614101 RepID=A0ABQ9GYW1_9NEOP|nr:hypothetical protein PR048_021693 [Dryococelus australis]
MRGQGHENGVNMRRKCGDAQSRILNMNPQAFFVPCTHAFNFVVADAALACHEAIGEIYYALYELSIDPRTDAFGKNTALSLARKLKSFKFVCCLSVSHAILFRINMVRKVLQRENMDISTAVELIAKIKSFLEHMRSDKGFEEAMLDAKETA